MPKKDFKMLADTASTDTRGTGAVSYALEPRMWLKTINEAAEELREFESVVEVYDVPVGTKDMVVPYRSKYLSSYTDTTAENTEIGTTTLDNLDGVVLSPSAHRHAIAISNYALDTNALNLIKAAEKDMTHYLAQTVDTAVATALNAATETIVGTSGAQTIYGGNATSTATLAAGDILTTDMIAEAAERLKDNTAYYWNAGVWTAATDSKNPWKPTKDEPFVLFVSPNQETELRKDSQFTNASEYGGNEVVLNGEIGNYLGIKIITTVQVPAATTWGAGGALRGHTCLMVKAGACAALAYGWRPALDVVDYKLEDQKRIIMKQSYAVETIHNDAVVRLRVLDA